MAVRLLLLTLTLATACGPSIPSKASSLFESDDEGWTIAGNSDASRPSYQATGGNQNGNLCTTDATPGDITYFVAPAKYLGAVSDAFGLRLTFDLKTSNQFNLLKGRDVVLNGGGLGLVQNVKSVPGLDWTPYAYRLDGSSGWLVEDSNSRGEPATEEQMKTVLRNLNAIRIRADFVDGQSDTTCLDNVYFGTP